MSKITTAISVSLATRMANKSGHQGIIITSGENFFEDWIGQSHSECAKSRWRAENCVHYHNGCKWDGKEGK